MRPVLVYFDYASPYSYLASALVPHALPGVAVEWRPMYLRGLEAFATGVPYTGAKLGYLARDVARSAAFHGIPLEAPATFPIDGLHALRAAFVAKDRGVFDAFHAAAFRAAWAERKAIGDKAIVAGILAGVTGDDPAALLEAMAAPANKERLRATTAEAAARGAFGAPAFFVDDELYWGHDRLDQVARAAGL